VRDSALVAEGVSTVFTANDPTAHAEVNAIHKACAALGDFALRGCEISPAPSRVRCVWRRFIGRISTRFILATIAKTQPAPGLTMLSLDRAERAIPSEQLLRDESAESFRLWEDSLNKREY